MINEIEDPIMGELTIPGFPLRFSAQPERLDLVAPTLGQHNAAVLSDVLGYEADRIAGLEQNGILCSAPR